MGSSGTSFERARMKEEKGLDAGRPSWEMGRWGISNSNLQTVRADPERGKKCSLLPAISQRLSSWASALHPVGPSHSPSQTLAHQEQSLQEGLEAQPCGLPLLWKDTQENETVRPWMASSRHGGQSIGAFTSWALIGFRVPSMPEPQELLTAVPHLWTLPALGQPGFNWNPMSGEIPKFGLFFLIWAFKGYDVIANELGLNPGFTHY